MKKIDKEKLCKTLNNVVYEQEFYVCNHCILDKNTKKIILSNTFIEDLCAYINGNNNLENYKKYWKDIAVLLKQHAGEFMVDEEEQLCDKVCKNLEFLGFKISQITNDSIKVFFHDMSHIFIKDEFSNIAELKELTSDCYSAGIYNLALENYQLKQQLEAAQNE